jgi:hypothetical protein
MRDLIDYIARALVDHPEEVSVTEVEGNQTSVLELKGQRRSGESHRQKGQDRTRHANDTGRRLGQTKKTHGSGNY